jgi:hypothetical protein
LLSVLPAPVMGCELLPPRLLLLMAPFFLTGSMTGVLGVVAARTVGTTLKCEDSAYFEPSLSRGQALWAMFLAHLVATVVGGFEALALNLPPLLFLCPLFDAFVVSPMQRPAYRAARRWLGPHTLSLLLTLLFPASSS